ncbi:MAG: glycine cleavage system protein R [Pseudomonadota bacterium]
MQNLLAVSVLGPYVPTATTDIAKLAADCNCNILDARITMLGNESAMLLLLAGTWNALAKFEHALPVLSQRLQLSVNMRRTTGREQPSQALPYSVQIVALDTPGILRDISQFFLDQGVTLQDIYSNTYAAPQTGAAMIVINIALNIPGNVHINGLRDQFQLLCDDLNLDGILEPIKG